MKTRKGNSLKNQTAEGHEFALYNIKLCQKVYPFSWSQLQHYKIKLVWHINRTIRKKERWWFLNTKKCQGKLSLRETLKTNDMQTWYCTCNIYINERHRICSQAIQQILWGQKTKLYTISVRHNYAHFQKNNLGTSFCSVWRYTYVLTLFTFITIKPTWGLPFVC